MSMLNTITKVTIAVEINGKDYFVKLPHDRALMVMNMAGGLSGDGRLHVVAAPASANAGPPHANFCDHCGKRNAPEGVVHIHTCTPPAAA